MKILNFGSLNLDMVYQVDHFVRPGETVLAEGMSRFFGGKGFNQSVALARAGVEVYHAGRVGEDGGPILQACRDAGVQTDYIFTGEAPTGHAIVQIDQGGENCILIHGGANQAIGTEDINSVLGHFSAEDTLLIQNEISCLPELIRVAKAKGLRIVFNPAPMNEAVHAYPLDLIDLFILNEIEAEELSGEADPARALAVFNVRYPNAEVVLTLGKNGAAYLEDGKVKTVAALPVTVVDTTAAGDTFVGYLLSGLLAGQSTADSIALANRAASLTVQTLGASNSIPVHRAVAQELPV